jgi:hypothetical protein
VNLRRLLALLIIVKALVLAAYFLESEPPSQTMLSLAYAGAVTTGGTVVLLAVLYLIEARGRS